MDSNVPQRSQSNTPSRWKWTKLTSPPNSSHSTTYEGEMDSLGRPRTARIIDSFRRDPNITMVRPGSMGSIAVPTNNGKTYDVEAAAQATASTALLRKLKGRHLQMIAIGGSIGTGLFVGSGKALAIGGPASLLLAFFIVGIMIYCTVQALGEMAVMFPVAGSFAAYSTRFLDPAWGFAMGWNYCLQWLVTMPLEIVSASITIDLWRPELKLNTAWVAVFLVVICSINLFGVKGYGEAEFVFSMVKVIAIIGYITLGCIVDIGGGPGGTYLGFKYWHDPGAFANGFKGLCSSLVTAAFAFAGTELVGLAAAETENPRKTLPSAVKQVFWRITLFYILSLLIVGLLVRSDDQRLLDSGPSDFTKASPFVISIQNAGIQVLPDIMNVVIMISVISVGNSAVYGSSRTLAALAEQRQAPAVFAYIDRKGRPLVAIVLASSLGFLAFMAATSAEVDVFNWLLSLSGLSSIFTWGSICAAHIRFRHAWKLQGHLMSEIAFVSPVGVWGSWVGLIMNGLVLIAQFWTGFAPVGWQTMSASDIAINFFQAYLAAPLVIMCYLLYKFWFKTKWVRARDMDLFTGKRDLNVKQLVEDERHERMTWPKWKKIYKYLC